jgi:hypothetical protein
MLYFDLRAAVLVEVAVTAARDQPQCNVKSLIPVHSDRRNAENPAELKQ